MPVSRLACQSLWKAQPLQGYYTRNTLMLLPAALLCAVWCSIPRHAKAVAELYGKKHPRWWVQSYLAGIPTLVLGGRDQTGTLHKVSRFTQQAGAKSVKTGGYYRQWACAQGPGKRQWLSE